MANLKEVRIRIASVNSTQQITKAMKMVSAAKLKRAQDAITQMRPYAGKLKEVLENVSASIESSDGGDYNAEREVNKVLVVPITSNRGLCGAFNGNVIKKVNQLLATELQGKQVTVLPIGKKAADYFRRSKLESFQIEGYSQADLNALFDKLTFDTITPVAEAIMAAFVSKKTDKVILVYNQFKNAGVQLLTAEQFLPVQAPETSQKKKTAVEYIFEPNKEFIVQDLIPKSLKIQFYKALLDSHASEHGARMTAMHKATDNAGALLKELKLSYNKARQAAITNEILEIVAGAEALNG